MRGNGEHTFPGTALDGAGRTHTFCKWGAFLANLEAFVHNQEPPWVCALIVNATPVIRRRLQKGEVGLEEFCYFQNQFSETTLKYIVLVVSDGMEGPVVRDNQKIYHPAQKVFAVDVTDREIRGKVDALRKDQVKNGKGSLSAARLKPSPP